MIEAALAHIVGNRVEAAYARSDLFERRRVLMDEWEGYLALDRGQDPGLFGLPPRWIANTQGSRSSRVSDCTNSGPTPDLPLIR